MKMRDNNAVHIRRPDAQSLKHRDGTVLLAGHDRCRGGVQAIGPIASRIVEPGRIPRIEQRDAMLRVMDYADQRVESDGHTQRTSLGQVVTMRCESRGVKR